MNPSLSSKISKVAAIIPAPEAEKSALQCLHDDLMQIEHVMLINSVFDYYFSQNQLDRISSSESSFIINAFDDSWK